MKKNVALFAGVGLFVALFYNQGVGLNLSCFALSSWVFLYITAPKENRSSSFWWLSVALWFSVGAFAWYGDFISFVAIFCTLVIITARLYDPGMNLLLIPFAGGINFASFIFRAPFIYNWLPLKYGLTQDFYKKALYYFLIPAALTTGFIIVYASSSSLFQSFFYINWDINFFQLAFLLALGFFLMFSFMHYWVPDLLSKQGKYLHDRFAPSFGRFAASHKIPDIEFYRKSGQITLIALNVLVIFFIITYSVEQFGGRAGNTTLSESLHERVYLLIFSILMAIAVILLFFKGALNFNTKNRLLKRGAFVWIGLNFLLVGIVALKNAQYIGSYGLTFKRVGVYLFLLLSATGLIYTTLKIRNQNTNIYLVNRMAWATYGTLIIGAAVNWSWIVTRYNLSHASALDKSYIYSLPYNKQLLYTHQLISADELSRLKTEQTEKSVLSQNLYYRLLHP